MAATADTGPNTRRDVGPLDRYQGELSSYNPSWREKMAYALADNLGGLGDNREGVRRARNLVSALEMIPPVGLATSLDDARRSGARGDYAGAGLELAMAGIPIKGAGKLAKAAGKAAKVGVGLPREAVKETAKEASKGVSGLFDLSRLDEVPDVPQTALKRYEPKKGASDRIKDVTQDRNTRDKMMEVVERGKKMGGARWYNTEPLRERFVGTLGKEAGNQRHQLYMDMVSATSPRSKVPENVRNASYYYTNAVSGRPQPAVGDKNPQPYGHMAQRLHQMNINRLTSGDIDPIRNPKPVSFAANLSGNQYPGTMDTHAFRLPAVLAQDPRFLNTAFEASPGAEKMNIQQLVESGQMPMSEVRGSMWQSQPNANEYKELEDYYRSIGQDLGLTTAQTQAAAWQGGGDLTGLGSDSAKSFMDFFGDRIMLTAEKTGKTPEKVLDDFIKGKAPLLSIGAAAGGLGLAAQGQQDQGQ